VSAAPSTLSQKPLFLIEGHASRSLLPALWVSADAYYNVGGETGINGVNQNNAANMLRLGMGMGLSVWSGGDVILNYRRTGCASHPNDDQTGLVSNGCKSTELKRRPAAGGFTALSRVFMTTARPAWPPR
jgi:hypothetical protein